MSQIKLVHTGGNGVIIAAPSSNPASDRTLTLPGDADGTVLSSASTLDATKLSGALPAISGANLTGISSGLSFALWRMNTGFTAPADPIVNWGANSNNVTLTESSGIFTFPSTGFWYIMMQMYGYKNSDQDNIELHIMTTVNNSSYGTASHAYSHMNKVKFKTINNTVNWAGQAGQNDSYAIFIRLGDT